MSDAHLIKFQCPQCGHELGQSIASRKQSTPMRCSGCAVGINVDTCRLANVAEEIRRALEKVPPEITIKFFHQG
jgi:ribosomal protein S27E